MDGIFMLNKDDLVLEDRLGQGNFGSVQRGTYKSRRGPIPVAVKVLKTGDIPHAEVSKLISFSVIKNELPARPSPLSIANNCLCKVFE
jgi:hypothetical protein